MAILSPVAFLFSPFSLTAPLLGTYFFPFGAVKASSGKLALTNLPVITSLSESTNRVYNLPSLCTNN